MPDNRGSTVELKTNGVVTTADRWSEVNGQTCPTSQYNYNNYVDDLIIPRDDKNREYFSLKIENNYFGFSGRVQG